MKIEALETNTTTQEQIKKLTEAMQQVLLEKNRRYGDSALSPRQIFSKVSAGEGIKLRLDDKLGRIINSQELRINDIADLIGYLFLLLIAEGATENDLLKLID